MSFLYRETEQLLENRKREIDALHKELAMIVSKQKLLEEKEQKIIDVENHRSQLEKDLAEMACKNQVIFFYYKLNFTKIYWEIQLNLFF